MSGYPNKASAEKAAATIMAYWQARGYAPSITIEICPTPDDSKHKSVFAVRSDMVNGLPPPSSMVSP